MEVFCPPQFAPSSIEHGSRLENAVRTGSELPSPTRGCEEAARFPILPTGCQSLISERALGE